MSPSKTRRLFVCAFLAAMAVIGQAYAQESALGLDLEVSGSPSPVGSGARAAGMADAFVAIADDATAASWNPAGLVQLERPEVSIVGSFNTVSEEFAAFFHDEVDSRNDDDNLDLNYFSIVYPLPVLVANRNVCVALNYQRKYDFSRDFRLDYDSTAATTTGILFNTFTRMDFQQRGGLSTITPAAAIELTHRFSVGASLNLWRSSFLSDNRWTQDYDVRTLALWGPNMSLTRSTYKAEYDDFQGENLVFGVLWNVTDRLSLGARYDSAFTGDVDYTLSGRRTSISLPSAWLRGRVSFLPAHQKQKRFVRFPASTAFGAAYRFGDRLTLSVDVTRTDWDDFWVKDSSGVHRSLVDSSNLDDPFTRPHFDPTHTIRLGAEYVCLPEEPSEELNHLWTLRAGLFYDEEPATGRSDAFRLIEARGNGEPDKFYGLAVGCGLQAFQRVNVDFAYQCRYGHNVNQDFIRGIRGFEEDVIQHRFLLSTVIYF